MIYLICFSAFGILGFFFSCRNKDGKKHPGELKYGFSKVADSIRYYDEILQNVDAASFRIIDEYYCMDNMTVFYHRTFRESRDYFTSKKHEITALENADPAAFESLGYGYAKDKSSAWWKDKKFEVSDVQSLISVDFQFVKDNVHVYLQSKMVPGVSGLHFERINNFYAKDDQNYFYIFTDQMDYRLKAIPCDYKSYEILDYTYSKDNKYVFYNGEKIIGSSSESFQIINTPYSKDHQRVYFRNRPIVNADTKSFIPFKENDTSMGETYYAKDNNHIFVNDKVFVGVDAPSFRILNEKYCTDKSGVYYNLKRVKNADVSSFKVFPHYIGDADAEDKNHRYGDGKVVD